MRDDGERHPQALTQALVERSPNGVLVTDSQGKITLTNPALRGLVPLVPECEGRSVRSCFFDHDLLEALDPSRCDEVEVSMVSGRRDLLVRVVPLGATGERLAIFHDVTKLKKVDRAQAEFVANVSHELRTPATAIAGYSETLLGGELEEDVRKMVEVIFRNAQRLTDIFEDLLHLSRMDALAGPLDLESLDTRGVVIEVVEKLRSAADKKQITLQRVMADGLRVMANRKALGHALANLVQNAIKYSHEGAVVTIRARLRNGEALIEVIDVGQGIDPAHHDRIFDRFYRVDKGRAREAGGTGLGLAICQEMVKAMGGRIELRSRPGSGSVFRVFLELADSTQAQAAAHTEPSTG